MRPSKPILFAVSALPAFAVSMALADPSAARSIAPVEPQGAWSIVGVERREVGALTLAGNPASLEARRSVASGASLGRARFANGQLDVTFKRPKRSGVSDAVNGTLGPVGEVTTYGRYRFDPVEGAFRGTHDGTRESLRRGTVGNSAELLIDGKEMLPATLAAIAGARERIHCESYWWADDESGNAVANALISRARGGIKVRALLDWSGCKGSDKLQARMKAAGVEVVAYNKLSLSSVGSTFKELWNVLIGKRTLRDVDGTVDQGVDNRDHRKVMVVDRQVALLGGICLCDPDVKEWHDVHVRVRGPVAANVDRHFQEAWNLGGGKAYDDAEIPVRNVATLDARDGLDAPRVDRDRGIQNVAIDVVTTVPGIRDEVKRAYLSRMGSARREILIENPYFADDDVAAAAKSAARRGVKVTVILPNDDTNDVKIMGAYHARLRIELKDAGIDVRSFPGMNHGKVALIDGRWSTVGSCNIDNRSFTRNLEANVAIDDPRFGSAMRARIFDPDTAKSRPWTSADQPKGFFKKVMGTLGSLIRDLL